MIATPTNSAVLACQIQLENESKVRQLEYLLDCNHNPSEHHCIILNCFLELRSWRPYQLSMASLSYDCDTNKLSSAYTSNSIKKWIQGETSWRSVGLQPQPIRKPRYNSQLLPCVIMARVETILRLWFC